ncbi:MAG: 3-hydroxyacyl-ACP dehydratase FabZ [Nitrospirota bacterium]|nr:3-hydroxyacyl-ACP dehydratase FabZ [Nitrospirota bacterium]
MADSALDINEIMRILPHRYPFLLVDRVDEMELGKRIVATKNVTINEPFFAGHFPGHPIMPGVLMIEAMAQVGGILAYRTAEDQNPGLGKKLTYFMGIDKAKFRQPVGPGDTLRMELTLIRARPPYWKLQGMAYVGEKLVCEAELAAMLTDG